MTNLLSNYSGSTKHTFFYLIIGLIMIIFSLFIPSIHNNFFIFFIFKIIIMILLGYSIYIIVSKSIPIIKQENTNLLAEANKSIRNNMLYNGILVIFIIILIGYVFMMNV